MACDIADSSRSERFSAGLAERLRAGVQSCVASCSSRMPFPRGGAASLESRQRGSGRRDGPGFRCADPAVGRRGSVEHLDVALRALTAFPGFAVIERRKRLLRIAGSDASVSRSASWTFMATSPPTDFAPNRSSLCSHGAEQPRPASPHTTLHPARVKCSPTTAEQPRPASRGWV